MTGQLQPLAQGKAAGAVAPYGSLLLKTGQTTQYNSELDDGYYEAGVAKSYTVNSAGAQSGTTTIDLTHLVSDSGAFTAADQTYTDAGKCGVFKAAGGETIVITGSASNNGVFTTASATANTVVFTTGIVNEADAPATTFKKREAISNNTVLDNNTGLTWARYYSVKFGVAGNGKMPYTGVAYDIFQYCAEANAASLGGHTDWRVPNIYEIRSLAHYGNAGDCKPNTTAFPSATADYFWSSSIPPYLNTWTQVANFYTGAVEIKATTLACFTYLVRGGI